VWTTMLRVPRLRLPGRTTALGYTPLPPGPSTINFKGMLEEWKILLSL
jgi:hypothetical protein